MQIVSSQSEELQEEKLTETEPDDDELPREVPVRRKRKRGSTPTDDEENIDYTLLDDLKPGQVAGTLKRVKYLEVGDMAGRWNWQS